MKEYIKSKIRESLIPSFDLPNKIKPSSEEYQMLKKDKLGLFMGAEEWKKERLNELKKEGSIWSK